jgi:hypothetical protein
MGVTEPVSSGMPRSEPENEPSADRKAIIKEFREAMDNVRQHAVHSHPA